MPSAELDYTIEIPDQPCRSRENSPNQGGKEPGTRQPLVILLGWGGCTDKNLAPLTALFHTHFYDRLLDAASRWPELYLYSRADEVVLARDVERMVEARLAQRVLVRSVDFVSSAHVSHLRDYPTYYTSLCVNFMRSCVHC
uniref:Transmembrane protein 53 n=1 Tax=Molossus molossus TaxID=27622 RepID=A0A7J8FCZ0_MOLMO|nr:transmembrane protein 53 [Molossus molossus]